MGTERRTVAVLSEEGRRQAPHNVSGMDLGGSRQGWGIEIIGWWRDLFRRTRGLCMVCLCFVLSMMCCTTIYRRNESPLSPFCPVGDDFSCWVTLGFEDRAPSHFCMQLTQSRSVVPIH